MCDKKGSAGRPTKWTKETRAAIIKHIKNGSTYKRAAILSGVSQSTFQEWKKLALEDRESGKDSEYLAFLEQIEQAQEKYIETLQQRVNTATITDGKLALEVLSRKRPEEFGRKDRLDLMTPEPLKVEIITEIEKENSSDGKSE